MACLNGIHNFKYIPHSINACPRTDESCTDLKKRSIERFDELGRFAHAKSQFVPVCGIERLAIAVMCEAMSCYPVDV